jgi:hypothetical protein
MKGILSSDSISIWQVVSYYRYNTLVNSKSNKNLATDLHRLNID